MITKTNESMINDLSSKENFVLAFCKEFIDRYPFMNNTQIEGLRQTVSSSYEDAEVEFFNSYRCETQTMKSSEFLTKTYSDRLILIENGMVFKPLSNQKELSPVLEVEAFLAEERDVMKDKMKFFLDPVRGNDPIKAVWFNNGQNSCKTDMNTLYGLQQTKTARVYNIDLPTSITCRGRSVVSVSALCLEGILGGYFPRSLEGLSKIIKDIDNKILYTQRLDHELYRDICAINVTLDDVMKHLKVTSDTPYYTIIYNILRLKENDVLSFLYITNNLRAFVELAKINDKFQELFAYIASTDKPFVNPYAKDDTIKNTTAYMQSVIPIINNTSWYQNDEDYDTGIKFVNTQETIKGIARTVIGLIDTDSNMVAMYQTLLTFYELFYNDVLKEKFTDKQNDFTFINAGTILVEVAVRDVLATYTDSVHIPEVHKPKVVFKNEYLYSMFLLTTRMKNYVGLCDIKEGVVFEKPKIDVKGLMYTKSSVNDVIGDIVGGIVKNDIIEPTDLDITQLLNKIDDTYNNLKEEMLSKNAYEYFLSEKINDKLIDVLDSISRTKSVEIYNVLGIYDKIIPPSKFLTINVDFNKLDFDNLSDEESALINRCLCYISINNIHKNLKKIHKLEPITLYNDRLQYIKNQYEGVDVNAVFDKLSNMINTYTANNINNTVYDLNMFENGYAKKIENTLTRDEMFYKIYELENGNLDAMMSKLETVEKYVKNMYKELKDMFITELTTQEIEIFGKSYLQYKAMSIYDINKISIPDALAENIPPFMSKLNNVLKDAIQIENLLSPVIESCNIVTVKNDADKTNITNVLMYF